jgi:hypothetical protein
MGSNDVRDMSEDVEEDSSSSEEPSGSEEEVSHGGLCNVGHIEVLIYSLCHTHNAIHANTLSYN